MFSAGVGAGKRRGRLAGQHIGHDGSQQAMCCQPCSCDPFTSCQVVPRQRTHGKDADLGQPGIVVRVQHRLDKAVGRAAVVQEGAHIALAQPAAHKLRLEVGAAAWAAAAQQQQEGRGKAAMSKGTQQGRPGGQTRPESVVVQGPALPGCCAVASAATPAQRIPSQPS